MTNSPVNHVAIPDALRREAVFCTLAIVAYVALFWTCLRELVVAWDENPDVSHGYLIPVISLWILWQEKDRWRSDPARASWFGAIVLIGGVALYCAGYATLTNVVQRLGLWTSLVGAVWFVLGSGFVRKNWFAFGFLLFAIPPPYALFTGIKLYLKGLATRTAGDLLALGGINAEPHAGILTIGEHYLEVADACSGVRSLIAIVATATLFAHVFRAGVIKGALLVLVAIPVTVVINVLRIVIVAVALVQFDIDLVHGFAHDALGVAVFGVSLALLYWSWLLLDWLLRWEPPQTETSQPPRVNS